MLRLAIDEDFNNDIVRGLLRRKPDLGIKRVQDAGLSGASDSEVLEWAAGENRVLFTHDVTTMTNHALQRVGSGQVMPGLFAVSRRVPVRRAIEDILLLAECSNDGEWNSQVRYLPL